MKKTLNARISHKYDTHEQWTTNNPVLNQGEIAVVVYNDRVCMKIGDGTSNYNNLEFTSAFAMESTPITTAGTGAAYTATVPWITALTAGMSFIMIPHTASTSTSPTINVNGLGAKGIKRRLSSVASGSQVGTTTSWILKGFPFRLIYDGASWVVEGMEKPNAADISGTVAAATKATQDGSGNVITSTYATISYVDGLVGDIESLLAAI